MRRHAWMAAGGTAFVLGMIGIVLPIMPTVPFLLLAAFCFSRSHPHLAEKLYEHPRYGPAMRNWRDNRAISRKAKVSAVIAMALGAVATWYLVGWPWILISLAILVIAGTWIITRAE